MSMPLIGVLPLWDEKLNSLWMLPGYMNLIERAGGVPVMLPLTYRRETIEQIACSCDGFLFTGGHDVSPEIYHAARLEQCGKPCAPRDMMEQLLFQKGIIELDKPALGICRGLQLFNALLGGTLYQDLPTQQKSHINHQQLPPYDKPVHRVTVLSGTPLGDLIDVPELRVNSYHHQAIWELSSQLSPMAVSEDGLIEAVYMPGRKFVYAVQWHPEFMPESPYSHILFQSFIDASIM